MVDKALGSVDIPCEAPDTVVDGDNIRIKASDEVVERIERRNPTAGGHVDINTEGGYIVIGMELGIGMHCKVAFVEVADNILLLDGADSHTAIGIILIGIVIFGNQQRYACALRLVVLLGYIQHMGTDYVGDIAENFCESFAVILLVDILEVIAFFTRAFGITYIIYVKTAGLCQVIEPEQLQLAAQPYHHVLTKKH